MSRRRMMLRKSELPVGYKRCEYLESTGTQYINTGIYPTNETSIEVTYYADSEDPIISFGSNIENGAAFTAYSRGVSGGITYCYGVEIWKVVNNGINYSIGKHTISLSHNGVSADGVKIVNFESIKFISYKTNHIYLFRRRGADKLYSLKLYAVTITEAENVVCNLIPALDPSCRPCMYDTVTKQPFYNQGTGEFLYELSGGY